MTDKLVVIINSLKVPKIKKILLYEMKFLVLNYSCLQIPWPGGTAPRSPFSLSSVLSWICWTLPPPEQNSWLRHCVYCHSVNWRSVSTQLVPQVTRTVLSGATCFDPAHWSSSVLLKNTVNVKECLFLCTILWDIVMCSCVTVNAVTVGIFVQLYIIVNWNCI